jgi:uncharacterized protein
MTPMSSHTSTRSLASRLWRATLTFVALAVLVVHIVAGWMFSSRIIDEAFTPPEGLEFGGTAVTALAIEEVQYDSPVGPIDAWFVDGSRPQWVIHVHGKGASLEEALPLAEAVAVAGYPQLIIGYRNDPGQPSDPSGYYGYGLTEHEDLAAAVDWAVENGAGEAAIVGYSTGGAIALSYLYKNPNAPVRSMVLDSPNADMAATIDLAASQEELGLGIPVPFTVTEVARTLASLRASINWESIDYVRRLDSLSVPALVFHGTDDATVPIETSRSMAEVRPQLIDLVEVEGAGHVASREVAGSVYDQRVLAFLEAHWR